MNEIILFIGSCIISLGMLLYGICWIVTCQQQKYLLPIFYQICISIIIIGGCCALLGIIRKNPEGVIE